MSDFKQKFGTTAQTLTCSLAPGGTGLANGNAREATAIDNRTNLFQDVLVQIVVKTGGSGATTGGVINIYAYGTVDDGTTYPDQVTGTDAAITLDSPTQLRPIGQINAFATSHTYKSEIMSVAAAFGGMMPAFWGIVIENKSGGALDGTEANHKKLWQGVLSQF